MTSEQIEKIISNAGNANEPLTIHFRDRQSVTGIFIQLQDYGELKSKNLWRVVREANMAEWQQTHNPNLNRIFNGLSFTRLSGE